MQEAVEEGEKSDHAPKLYEPLNARDLAKRRDTERDRKED